MNQSLSAPGGRYLLVQFSSIRRFPEFGSLVGELYDFALLIDRQLLKD
jgi:hypothetical protein